jgi:hypothetical protein
LTDASLLAAPDRSSATPLPAIGKRPPFGGECGHAKRLHLATALCGHTRFRSPSRRLWRRFDGLTQPAPQRPLRGRPSLHLCAI